MKPEGDFSTLGSVLRRPEGERRYLVVFGALGQVEGGVGFGGALLAERRQLEGDRLRQAVARFQLQQGRVGGDLLEVSEGESPSKVSHYRRGRVTAEWRTEMCLHAKMFKLKLFRMVQCTRSHLLNFIQRKIK